MDSNRTNQNQPFSVEANLLHASRFATSQELYLLRQLSADFHQLLNPIYFDVRNEPVAPNNIENVSDLADTPRLESIEENLSYIYRTLKLNHNIFYWTENESLNLSMKLIRPYIKNLQLIFSDGDAKGSLWKSTLDEIISTAQYFPNLRSITFEIFHYDKTTTNLPRILETFRSIYGNKLQITIYLCGNIPMESIFIAETLPKLVKLINKFGVNYSKVLFLHCSMGGLGFIKSVPGQQSLNLELDKIHLFNDLRPMINDREKFSSSMKNIAPYIKSFGVIQYNNISEPLFPNLVNPSIWTKLQTLRLDLYKIPLRFIKRFPYLKKLILVDCNWNECLFSQGNLSNEKNLNLIFSDARNLNELVLVQRKKGLGESAGSRLLNGFDKLDSNLVKYLKSLVGSNKVTVVPLDSENCPKYINKYSL